MRVGVARRVGGLALALVVAASAQAAEPGVDVGRSAEVRVLSGPGTSTTLSIRASPDAVIDDRTTGAHPSGPSGPASTGETFSGELTLFLRPAAALRPASIDVNDPLVSSIRLFPEPNGTTVTVFVRQPVLYTVARPSALGDVRIELRARTRPLAIAVAPRGRVKATRPESKTGEQEVAVDAESLSYDQQTNTLTARGGVTLTRGDTVLTADEVVYDRTNLVAQARGHVVMTDPQARVVGDFAHLNLEDESGWIEHADALLEPTHFTVAGGKLEKLSGGRYSIANGVFTTCECGGLEGPSWSIAGKQTDVQLEGQAVMHGMTFRVKDVPVLYFPYFVFPANTQRQTGLLIPRVGYSNRRGFQYEQPFFWAINKTSDATVALDVETNARLGMIGEYRYRLSRSAHGEFAGAYYNEQIRGQSEGTVSPGGAPVDVPTNRYILSGHHVSPFYGGSHFYLDMFAVSDDNVLREINSFAFSTSHDLALRSTRYTTSRTGVIKTWPEGLVWVENAYYQDLINRQELALERLPRVTAEHGVPMLNDHVVGRFNAETTNFQRQEGYDGLRADLAPELFVPFRLGRAINGSINGRVRETAYHLTNEEQVAYVVSPTNGNKFRLAPGLPALDQDHTREIAEVNARTSTEISRVYDFPHWGIGKIKHTIEPEAQYLYVPQVSRPITDIINCSDLASVGGHPQPGINCTQTEQTRFAEGYLFDERDAINHRNFFSYGFTTRVLARPPATPAPESAPAAEAEAEPSLPVSVDPDTLPQGLPAGTVPQPAAPAAPGTPAPAAAGPPRELLRATILHGYDVSRTLVGSSHGSDVDLGIRVTPVDYLGLSYNTTVNLQDKSVRGFTVGGVVREPYWAPTNLARNFQNPSTLGVSYRFIEKGVNRVASDDFAERLLLGGGTVTGVNEIDSSFYLRLGDYLGFTFLSRYDLSTSQATTGSTIGPHFLERDYLLRMISRCNCWVVEAGVADKTNPDERLFRVQFTLIGLGSFGQSPGTHNYVGLAPLSQLGLRRPAALGGGLGY